MELRQRLVVCRLIGEDIESDIRAGKIAEKRLKDYEV